MGPYKIVALITLASILSSVLVTSLLLVIFADGLNWVMIIVSIIVPMIIAPIASWYIVSLIFKIHKLEQVQRDHATYDMLTGLMTRRVFLENSETLLKILARNKQPMSLAFIDLDDFKRVNDLYGHAGGDEVLKSFSSVLQNHLRKSDLVGRIGGEEFAITLPNTDLVSSVQVLEGIRLTSQNDSVKFSGKTIHYTISIGIVLFHEANQVSLESLIRQSDTALYRAKALGKNCIVEYQTNNHFTEACH